MKMTTYGRKAGLSETCRHSTYREMASIVTAASAFAAAAVPPVVEPLVAQHDGALKTKQSRLAKNITLGFRVPILGNSDSKPQEPRQTI